MHAGISFRVIRLLEQNVCADVGGFQSAESGFIQRRNFNINPPDSSLPSGVFVA